MSLQPDDKSLNAPGSARRGWLRATIVAVSAIVFVTAAIGFVGFLSKLRGAETKAGSNADRTPVNPRSTAAQTRRWARDRGFKSLIVVTSNYHMPRAIVELSHAMPDVELIPFAVVGDKGRDEPWWTSGATLRLLLSEYVKYVAAEVRVRLADAGLELTPELADQPIGSLRPRRATVQAN